MMKQLFAHINRKFIKTAFLLLTVFVLSAQSAGTALAASPVQNSPRAKSTQAELDRRSVIMTTDKKLVQDAGANSVSSSMVEMVDAVQHTIGMRKQSLSSATTNDQVTTVASNVDSDYAEFRAVDLAVKLYADLKAQDKSIQQLRVLAQQIQDTVNAAKANGATHVNAGVAGFVLLDLINNNVDKLKKSLTAGALTTVALNSAISLLSSDEDVASSSSSAALTQLYDQLSVTQTTLTNIGLGLSQLSSVVTGNRTGISYCGFWANCQGNENNGVIQACGTLSTCKDNTNNGDVQTCGTLANCKNNTNEGTTQKCGLLSNCQDNTNNGVTQTCGTLSACANNTNNGLFVNCGTLSICAGNTNNGLTQKCGTLSNCQNNTNNGLSQTCGLLSNCQNVTNNSGTQTCGTLSNCNDSTNNGVAVSCGLLSDCSKSINNGGVIQCGTLSNCSGATNNGLLLVCGTLSNCSGAETSGFASMCGDASSCSNGSTHSSFVTICGTLSNCSTTVQECKVDSAGKPVTASADTTLSRPLSLQSASI